MNTNKPGPQRHQKPYMNDFEHLNHYELLGVSENASEKEIKSAYYQQVAQYHPDRYATAPEAEQAYASKRMQKINEAYRILSKRPTRSAYQRSLETASVRGQGGSRSPRPTPPPPPPSSRDYQAELYEIALEHIADNRYMQAIATLRELQRLNPFYRDSAALLSQAEAALASKSPRTQPTLSPTPPRPDPADTPPPRARPGFISIIGGLIVLLLIGITGIFLFFPQLMVPSGEAREVAATANPGMLLPDSTLEEEIAAETAVIALLPTTASPIVPTPTASPVIATATPTPTIATPTAEATATPPPTIATPTTETTVTPPPTIATPTTETTVTPPPTIATPTPETTATPSSTPTQSTPTVSPLAAAAEGGTLLQSFTDFAGWAMMQGNGWSVGSGSGGYQVFSGANVGYIWSYRGGPRNTGMSIGTNVQIQGAGAGLVFYFVDAQNYLAFIVEPEQSRYVLEQQAGGQKTILAQGTSSSLLPTASEGEIATNRLVVHLDNQRIRLFINATPVVDEIFGSVFPANQYGFLAIGGTVATTATFTNLEIRTLPGSP